MTVEALCLSIKREERFCSSRGSWIEGAQDGLAVEWQEGPPGMRRLGKAMEEGEYPVIGYVPNGAPQFGSMRMKVIEEKMVDGYKVKVLPAGYAEGAYPSRNASVRS
jgi:hypothetical protein